MKDRFENLFRDPKTNEFYKDSDRRRIDDPEGLEVVGRIISRKGVRAFFFRQPEEILWLDKDAQGVYTEQQQTTVGKRKRKEI